MHKHTHRHRFSAIQQLCPVRAQWCRPAISTATLTAGREEKAVAQRQSLQGPAGVGRGLQGALTWRDASEAGFRGVGSGGLCLRWCHARLRVQPETLNAENEIKVILSGKMLSGPDLCPERSAGHPAQLRFPASQRGGGATALRGRPLRTRPKQAGAKERASLALSY